MARQWKQLNLVDMRRGEKKTLENHQENHNTNIFSKQTFYKGPTGPDKPQLHNTVTHCYCHGLNNMCYYDNGRWTQYIFLIIITIISPSLQREKDYGSNQNKPYYFNGTVTCKALFTGHQSTHTLTHCSWTIYGKRWLYVATTID